MSKTTELNIEPLTRIEGHMGVNAKADLETRNIQMLIAMPPCSVAWRI